MQATTNISRALRLMWRERRLWPAALVVTWSGSLAEVELLRQSVDFGEPGLPVRLVQAMFGSGLLSGRGAQGFVDQVRNDPLAVGKVALVWGIVVGVLAALTWISVVGQAAMVHGAAFAAANRPIPLATGWVEGRRRFWTVLGLNVIAKVAVVGVLAALIPISSGPLAVFAGAFVVAAVLAFAVLAWLKLAVAAAVLEHRSLLRAARRGFYMLTAEWHDAVALVASLAVLTFALFTLLMIVVVLALMPFLLVLGAAQLLQFTAGARVYVILSWLVMAAIAAFGLLLIGGVHWVCWTTLYAKAAAGRRESGR
ncbi:MAG: hypothetical protein Q7S23_03195 [bacterium]|nr:hypothetical protein [bacterium]